MALQPTGVRFFATPADLRAWLAEHHADSTEQWIGYHRKASGKPSITWPQSVEQALCFGWIDGIRRGLDDSSYAIRFTPRRARSTWSAVNIETAQRLIADGLMQPAGKAAFEARRESNSRIYSFERREPPRLDPDQQTRFESHAEAWHFFQGQPPGYRRTALHWVVSAKRDETRERRLDRLIADSAAGRRLAQLTRPA